VPDRSEARTGAEHPVLFLVARIVGGALKERGGLIKEPDLGEGILTWVSYPSMKRVKTSTGTLISVPKRHSRGLITRVRWTVAPGVVASRVVSALTCSGQHGPTLVVLTTAPVVAASSNSRTAVKGARGAAKRSETLDVAVQSSSEAATGLGCTDTYEPHGFHIVVSRWNERVGGGACSGGRGG